MFKINRLSFLFLGLIFGQTNPGPPSIPEIQAVASNEKVLLMWDNVAESSKDALTGYSDFEGYRVYRSTDGGITWGDLEDRIFDFSGNFVGWNPYAQFDLVEESDSLHCIYKNGYLGESGELCYSLGYDYDKVPSTLLSSSNVIIDEDSLVYLPKYIRGNCPPSQEHAPHLSSQVHVGFDDCYNGGYLTDFDPMASWINLGKNDSLKRTFVDTNVLDGVEYTYAVTAYDTGLETFQVNYINTDANAASTDNYCDGKDSYCNGSDFYCDGDGSFCSDYDSSIWGVQTDEQNCTGGFIGGTWNVVEYTDSTSCVNHGVCDEGIGSHVSKVLCDNENAGNDVHTNNPGSDEHWNEYGWNETIYSLESTCESANYEWVLVEYFDEFSCEAVDNDNDGISDHEWIIIYFTPDTTWSSWNPGHHLGLDYTVIDQLWGYPSFESPKTYEPFTDYNSNGICDNEPYIDLDSSDGNQNSLCDFAGDWSIRCPDDINDCRNVIVVTPGYKASNITFPSDTPEVEFIIPDTGNKGNGARKYNIVNEYDLTDAILRFEINAGLDPRSFGDSTGSFATLDPSLYIYEAISLNNMNPLNSGDSYIVDGMSNSSLDSLLGLPGANYNSDGTEIVLPEYKLENFKLTYIDDPLYDSHFTNWFDGIQFRFDNGPNKINDVLSLVEIKDMTFSDTLYLKNVMSIKMKYNAASDISKRPMYRYRIDFSTSSVLDTATYGTGRDCDQYFGYPNNNHTFLPFKITNITNDKPVVLSHVDNGVQSGGIEYNELTGGCTAACNSSDLICIDGTCVDKTGDKDCSWQRNEILQLTDVVFSDEHQGGIEDILFDLKIDFNYMSYVFKHVPNFFEVSSSTGISWSGSQSYGASDVVLYEGMLFEAQSVMPDSTIPTYWFDDDGDNMNDNPWKMLYPWEDGDYIIIEPYGWYQDGDAWVADLSVIGNLDEDSSDDLNDMSVVPNPYIVNSNYFNESPGNNLLRFTRLPNKCTISIYTITGEFVTTIDHDDPFDGNEFWDLKNGQNQEIAPGLYIYVVKTPDGNKKIDKFAVVR